MAILEIDLTKIRQNTANVKKALNGIDLTAVAKGCHCEGRIVKAMVQGGAQVIADSRITNFKELEDLPVKKMLLRAPLREEPVQLLNGIDYILIASQEEAKKLAAIYQGRKRIGIILNIETGFGREGMEPAGIKVALETICGLKSFYFAGFATNTACGASPNHDAKARQNSSSPLKQLNLFTNIISPFLNPQLSTLYPLIVSGGNSSVLPWVKEKGFPKSINQLRIGEAILLGHDTAKYKRIASSHIDAFKLNIEAVHFKTFNGRNLAILPLGLQEIGAGHLTPIGNDVKRTARVYSDYLSIELAANRRSKRAFSFKPDYYALLALMKSSSVSKKYLES